MKLPMLSPPAFGEPCNGCGRCCQEEVCGLGREAFGSAPAPCPALRARDGRFWCGIIEEATKANVAFGAHMERVLGIGRGCDAEF